MGVIRDRFGRAITTDDVAGLRTTLRSVLEGLGLAEEVPWDPGVAQEDAPGATPVQHR